MKLALIADIHGNLFAFDAILEDIHQRQIKQILCLGDVASGGPQPCEVIHRLREINCPIVMGNTDAWLLEPCLRQKADQFGQYNQEIEYWCSQQLSEEDQAFLRTFQPTIVWTISETQTLLAYHGSPRSFREQILPTTPDEQLDTIFANVTAQILAGGHTHQQLFRRYRDKLVLNPGSVGMAMDCTHPFSNVRNPPWGEYAIVNIEGNQLSVELLRVPFDIEGFLEIHFQCGMPHAEWSASLWNKA
jgi:predicted phosphodiesterase